MSRIKSFLDLPFSRRLQVLSFKWLRAVTRLIHARRLRKCGPRTAVGTPLYWTPEFISVESDVLIWPGCRIEGMHGAENGPPHSHIGHRVSLQQHCHIVAAGFLSIGDDTTISFNVMITDVDHEYEAFDHNVMHQPLRYRPTSLGRCCFIGAGAKLLAGTRLGDNCVVGANSVVRGQFPDGCVLAGVPARVIKRYHFQQREWRSVNADGEFI